MASKRVIQVQAKAVLYQSGRLGASPQDLITLAAICKYRVKPLAKMLGVSIRTLERDFHAYLRCRPKVWLAKQRILYAKKLLLNGCSIEESAERLGFSSPLHFSREFRAKTGVSPRSWLLTERLRKLEGPYS